ncbi:uncharacterized protein EMH_0083790 [Eimeria mitis]|uniref:Uncharacterized protein n=1 Tax=Eimeria mitis TaxID=44415 RepID=U6JQW3_9EIME|nr:uncharacterized protein EMH_0083790 [Eimeria mitis]CDJ27246.1 hypothetical protein, conserved [Eimeria mitis]
MQPPGCSGPGAFYGPPSLAYMQPQGPFSARQTHAARQEQSEPSVQTCVRDSVRMLGEAVAVLEGVRLLGSQLLQWGGEINQVLQSVIPAALILQIGRWMYTRTIGASKRHTIQRMHKAWREASEVDRLNYKFPMPTSSSSSSSSSSRSRSRSASRWLLMLRDFSALLALIVVAAELYIHFSVYRRLLGRLRVLTAKKRGLEAAGACSCSSCSSSSSSSNGDSGSNCCSKCMQ